MSDRDIRIGLMAPIVTDLAGLWGARRDGRVREVPPVGSAERQTLVRQHLEAADRYTPSRLRLAEFHRARAAELS
ncbi:hypothetical protein [Streptomyces syringium]|uniref:hypothetical protein n=1 Tax=Streptomyces syringium TaxID=76729 RepID=UPI0034518BFC